MRRVAVLLTLVLAACGDDKIQETAPVDASLCGTPPQQCAGRCTISVENVGLDDCCDSITCNCKPSTMEWEVIFCEPPFDAMPPDAG